MIWVAIASILIALVCAGSMIRAQRARALASADLSRANEANDQLAAHAANYHQKLRALSESSGAGMVVLDPKGAIIHANAAAGRILNFQGNDLVGHSLIHATLSSEMQQFVVAAASSGQPTSQDFQMSGSPSRVLRGSVHSLSPGLSGMPEVVLILVDVTELHRLETIRRDFVANVSHELRTPLASIRAIAETLYEGALHDEEVAGSFLETIIREADRLGRISQDLLVLSDAESKEPQRGRFNSAILVSDVVERSKKHAEQSGVKLSLSVPPDLPLFASRDQMEQVLVNLVDNAIKYTAAEGSVCVKAYTEDERVIFSVSDTGIGIMHQDLPRIFERFYRVDKARSRESGGTGLGLSIVKNIVEAHHGEVKVLSEFNRGSTFIVSLPIIKDS